MNKHNFKANFGNFHVNFASRGDFDNFMKDLQTIIDKNNGEGKSNNKLGGVKK